MEVAFRREKIKRLVNEGVTAILVSHDLNMVEKYCNRVIWMEKGKIKRKGRTREVVRKYEDNLENYCSENRTKMAYKRNKIERFINA